MVVLRVSQGSILLWRHPVRYCWLVHSLVFLCLRHFCRYSCCSGCVTHDVAIEQWARRGGAAKGGAGHAPSRSGEGRDAACFSSTSPRDHLNCCWCAVVVKALDMLLLLLVVVVSEMSALILTEKIPVLVYFTQLVDFVQFYMTLPSDEPCILEVVLSPRHTLCHVWI